MRSVISLQDSWNAARRAAKFTKMDALMGEEIEETGDFVVNEKDKIVNLTEQGVKKVEQFFHIENLADPENLEIQHNIDPGTACAQPDVP